MAIKLGKVMTYYEMLQQTKLDKALSTWLRDSMWYVKNIISTTTMSMATKPGRVIIFSEDLPSINSKDHLNVWFCKLTLYINMLYLHYHNDYSFQTWQGGSIQ